MSPPLNPDKALIFRIVHVDNLPWLLHHGLPWNDWQQRDFTRRVDDLDRFERYQAEALAHQMLPIQALLGVVVYAGSV